MLARHSKAAGGAGFAEAGLTSGMTIVAGIPIPSTSPLFLAGVGLHIAFALVSLVSGAVAMLSPKRPGRHPWSGSIYFWSLAGVFVSATALAASRWSDDYQLFLLGAVSFAAATLGRQARRHQWLRWPAWHVTGMGLSYIVMLTAFYVDNGKYLPLWRELPPISYWLAPSLFGLSILVFALCRHPVVLRYAGSRTDNTGPIG